VTDPGNLVAYLRRYRPGMSREEVATACGVSIATLTRRLREGLDTAEVIRAARYFGASPTEALLELGVLEVNDVRRHVAIEGLHAVSETTLISELLRRTADRNRAIHDR